MSLKLYMFFCYLALKKRKKKFDDGHKLRTMYVRQLNKSYTIWALFGAQVHHFVIILFLCF